MLSKLAYSVAAATIIGGGTVVLNAQTRLAVLEDSRATEEHRLERIEDKLDIIVQQGIAAAHKREAP